jgi:hypothetical protein
VGGFLVEVGGGLQRLVQRGAGGSRRLAALTYPATARVIPAPALTRALIAAVSMFAATRRRMAPTSRPIHAAPRIEARRLAVRHRAPTLPATPGHLRPVLDHAPAPCHAAAQRAAHRASSVIVTDASSGARRHGTPSCERILVRPTGRHREHVPNTSSITLSRSSVAVPTPRRTCSGRRSTRARRRIDGSNQARTAHTDTSRPCAGATMTLGV